MYDTTTDDLRIIMRTKITNTNEQPQEENKKISKNKLEKIRFNLHILQFIDEYVFLWICFVCMANRRNLFSVYLRIALTGLRNSFSLKWQPWFYYIVRWHIPLFNEHMDNDLSQYILARAYNTYFA